MAIINTGPLPIKSLNIGVLEALKDPASGQIVSDQLNTVLRATLIASANNQGGLPALVSLLQTLRPADFAADQNLSLRDFVTKYATLPTDPAANKAAQQAIATLSTSTTVGQFLGLNQTIAANPIFSGFAAQTNLVSLMATSPTLASAPLQTDFIQKYTSHQGSTQDFWNQISQDATLKAAIPELQFAMQLGVLTLNNAALVSALRASYKPTSIRDLTKLNVSTLTQLITTQKISVPAAISGSTAADQIGNYVSGMVALLQSAFPTDYVAQALSSSKDTTLQSVAKVIGNAPDIDLQSTNLSTYLKQNSATAFQGIPPAQINAVTARLEGTQRVFRISQQPNVVAALLGVGMDSAAKITARASSTFVSQFSAALGGDSVAQSVYAAASHINAQSLNLYSTIQNGLRDVSPRVIANPNLTTAQAIQQQIPNWQTLFGPTSYCICGECSSVYGPAAYFVDLLQFLRNSALNSAGNSPLDILIGNAAANPVMQGRRPDLQYINLNCENANTPLPYVDLVNEVLESYVALGGALGPTTAHNTQSDATADELRVNPEYVIQSAYDVLAQAAYPQSLPYDRFLDIARTYLTFLGGDRRQVIERFGTQVAPFDTVGTLAAETLGLSPTEFKLIANWDLASGSATTPFPLNSLFVGNAPATSPWETWIANASVFLQQTDLSFDDLINLLEAEFINPGQTITLAGAGSCDITQTVITPLDDSALTRIYPFLRLWKKLGWSMSDLDQFLRVFGGSGVNRGCLLALADFVWLKTQLNLTVAQLSALWSEIDADGRDSLYISLFQNKAVLNPVDSALQLSYRAPLAAMPANPLPASVTGQVSYDPSHQLVFLGAMTDEQRADLLTWASGNPAAILAVENLYEMRWSQGTDITQGAGTTLTEATPAILAALSISADDLTAIRTATGLTDSATKTPLTLSNLSQLYRYTVLAQSIGLSIPDLIALISLSGINPFQLATSDPVTQPAVQFVRAARAVLASPFAVSDLNYVYRAVSNPAVGVGPLETTVDLVAITLQTGLVKIATANSYTPDPTGKVLRQKLGTIIAGSGLDGAMGLISGTALYKSPLTALPPGVIFPAALAPFVSYDATTQELEFSGAMTDAQKNALVGLSTDSNYDKAVSDLYQQPREIISNSLSFLDPALALSNLITSPLPSAADRYAFVLQALLNYLTDTQSRSFIQQTLGETLGLSSAMVALLLVGDPNLFPAALLQSQRDSGQPGVVDLLDLRQGGLLATLYSDVNLTTIVTTQVEAQASAAGVSNPGGARWQGKIEAEFSEPYTFYVTANDGVRLWIDDQLLIDQWSSQAISTRTSAPINLNAGQLYDIRLEYFNTSASAAITLGWSSKSTNNNVNTPVPVTAMFPENAFLTLDRMYPVALLSNKFVVKPDELAYLSSHGTAFQGVDPGNAANLVKFDLTALPLDRSNSSAVDHLAPAFFNQWLRLNELFQLRNSLPAGNTTLFDIFRAASGSTNPAVLGRATTNTVLAATGWDALQFSTLAGKTTDGSAIVGFGLSDADFVNEIGSQGRGLVWLQACFLLSQRLGVPVLQLFLWANQTPDSGQSDDIKSTVKAKYDDATWTTVGQPLNDKIRDHSKSALIAYVLNMPHIVQLGYTSADDLYTYFLIDVQMSPCMQTSRIVQATAAVQLFVQRCLLNLESNNSNAALNVSPGAIDASQWEWRKNYRVWEANREVFLYPENWIDPTLRDNRTPLFEDLQTDLQKGPVTADTAEAAFQNYLTNLLEVSRLEICGFFYENDSDNNVTHNIFHVFGRTYATPHVYYYRTFDRVAGLWSAWDEVDVAIQGDQLIPVVWNRRLYIFWPVFQEQTTPNTAAPGGNVSVPTAGGTAQLQAPLKSLQVYLAWSEYRDGAWTKKQVTTDSLIPNGWESYNWDFDPSVFSFNAQPNDPSLTINMFYWRPAWDIGVFRVVTIHLPFALFNCGSFFFDGCSSVPAISSFGGQATSFIPYGTSFDYMSLNENQGGTDLELTNLTDPHTLVLSNGMEELVYTPAPVTVLGATPLAFSLAYPSEDLPDVQINQAPPFFYADNVRTYLVTQQSTGIGNTLANPLGAVVPYSPEELSPAVSSTMVASLPVFADEVPVATAAGTLPAAQAKTATPTTTPALTATTALTATPINATPWEAVFSRPTLEFTFATHRHAHVCDFLKALNWQGVPGLLTLDIEKLDSQDVGTASMFYQLYQPTNLVNTDYPSEQVDFSYGGAYSIYNWEIFFHIPLLIATQLSQNQQFEDAETWFRYIFNPTSNSTDPVPGRYWNFLPFNQNTDPERIEDLVDILAYTGSDPTLLAEKASLLSQIAAWEQTPFDPDLIARMRIVAYQEATVMKYIDHQLAWGDSLYQQFTRESVNEATLHYVLCQDILGEKPVVFPPQGFIADQTYAGLVAAGLDAFSDTLVTLENLFPFASSSSSESGSSGAATGIAVPYFCVPPNDTLLGYWDTVAQRLYQIRHCMNIAGQVQTLPLFAPPINPGALIQALEMGMDLTSALSDISAATPFYRFAYMLPKAVEFCAEVRSLGASLLSALEKSDAEALYLLRATQETALMKAIRNVKQQQLNEANSNLDALNDTLAVTQARQQYYQSLIAAGLISEEQNQLSELGSSRDRQTDAEWSQLAGAVLSAFPNLTWGGSGCGGSPVVTFSIGGTQEGGAAIGMAGYFQILSAIHSTGAVLAGLQGGWDRRNKEWQFQLLSATLETQQINDQIKASQARVNAAQADLDNQDLQISNASDIENFLRTKYTNQDLYDWMVGQVSSVYFQCYQMAYDLAKRAEACYVFERMPNLTNYSSFIQFGYWDSLRKGLLSGERLYQDLKRLEIAYMDSNQRDFEITKSISLLLLDPIALINLKETGYCTVQFPEALFDMDYPGFYLRRMVTMSMTVPCVVGRYANLNCMLTLATNKIRVDNNATDAKDYVQDSHFVTNFAASESIATSSGQNDSGLFVVNFNDDRYLPFEGAGVISTWQLLMPPDTNAFDFDTITDVIFTLKYTARDGGAALRSVARAAAVVPPGSTVGATPASQTPIPAQQTLSRMFSLRHEFPSDWNAFLHPPDAVPDQTMTINLMQERFPFQYRGKKIQIYEVDLFLKFRDIYDPVKYTANGTPLGDYAAGTALTLNLTPPGGTAKTLQLASNAAVIAGVPAGSVPQPPPVIPPTPPVLGALGSWTLVAKGADIGAIAASLQTQVTVGTTTNNRLVSGAIEDVFLVCYFLAQ